MVSAIADTCPPFLDAAAMTELGASTSVKLLDLLTNRYHAGVLKSAGVDSFLVEVPPTARMRAGQRVRWILAPASAGVLSRGQMRRAAVTHVEVPSGPPRLLLELAYMDDPTAS